MKNRIITHLVCVALLCGLERATLAAVPYGTKRTQTEAYLSLPHLKTAVEDAFHLKTDPILQFLVNDVIAHEKVMSPDHYIFYHGQGFDFRVFQDVMKVLLQVMSQFKMIKQFQFLRVPDGQEYPAMPVSAYLSNLSNEYGTAWSDGYSHIAKKLVSVNLSLFGNTLHIAFGECTFSFFKNSSNISAPPLGAMLENFFKMYDFPLTYLQDLVDLSYKYKTKEGNLLQICIPKFKVDECAYLCYAYGKPYDKPLVPEAFNPHLKRHSALGPVLDKYCAQPESIIDIDALQARLFMSSSTFLNPYSGIKVFRYTTMPKSRRLLYKKELKKLIEKTVLKKIDQVLKP